MMGSFRALVLRKSPGFAVPGGSSAPGVMLLHGCAFIVGLGLHPFPSSRPVFPASMPAVAGHRLALSTQAPPDRGLRLPPRHPW